MLFQDKIMTIDFALINDKRVGWEIKKIEASFRGTCAVEVLFQQFVQPYLESNRTYAEVYNRLKLSLIANLEGQGVADKKDLSRLLKERGILTESVRLIKQNYSQFL